MTNLMNFERNLVKFKSLYFQIKEKIIGTSVSNLLWRIIRFYCPCYFSCRLCFQRVNRRTKILKIFCPRFQNDLFSSFQVLNKNPNFVEYMSSANWAKTNLSKFSKQFIYLQFKLLYASELVKNWSELSTLLK